MASLVDILIGHGFRFEPHDAGGVIARLHFSHATPPSSGDLIVRGATAEDAAQAALLRALFWWEHEEIRQSENRKQDVQERAARYLAPPVKREARV